MKSLWAGEVRPPKRIDDSVGCGTLEGRAAGAGRRRAAARELGDGLVECMKPDAWRPLQF